ncbi:MAG: C-terminal binding protein [Haloferacaceae archaeon]
MTGHTVVVTDHDFEDLEIEREVLGDVAEVVALADDVGDVPADTAERLADADAVLNLRYEIDADAIARMDDCRVIARYGIGVDNVAVDAAADRGIPVTNVPDYCLEEVATHALSLMLSLARGLKRYDASVAAGEWDRGAAAPLHRFSTRTVGVVGYGAIGREVGARATALGADVLASDPFLDSDDVADDPATLTDFEDLCARADVVTVHSPLTSDTRGLLDADAFARMDDDAVVINVARGPIVDVGDLHDALEAGEVGGAGLDVFPEEPPGPDHPLRDHPRVVTTPHVAWYSEEAGEDRRRRATEIVRDVLTGGDPENVVNGV